MPVCGKLLLHGLDDVATLGNILGYIFGNMFGNMFSNIFSSMLGNTGDVWHTTWPSPVEQLKVYIGIHMYKYAYIHIHTYVYICIHNLRQPEVTSHSR